jgi:DNA-binding winged helix-turn-helix (wHTH) protein
MADPAMSADAPSEAAPMSAHDDGYVYFGNRPVKLPPKEQAVLHLLVRRSPAVVDKDEFASLVWPGHEMSDESLTRCIHRIRRTLREISSAVRVESLYGRGYRLTFAKTAESGLTTHRRLMVAAQAPPQVAEAFLYARQLAMQRTSASMAKAEQILRETVKQAPGYAPARVALAECLAGSNSWGISTDPQLLIEGLEHLDIAERLSPAVAGLHSARAYLLDRAWRFDEAARSFASALRSHADDGETHFHYGWHLLATGQAEAARAALRQAVRLHPYAVLMRVTLARAHAHACCVQEALQEAQAACDLAPGNQMAELYLTGLRAWAAPTPAVVEAAWRLALLPDALTLAPAVLSYALARTGQAQDALDVIDACTQCRSGNDCSSAMHAASLLVLGQVDAALSLLHAAASAHCGLLPVLLHDPTYAGLKQHPSFLELQHKVYGSNG